MKRLLSAMLVLCLLCSIFSASALAAGTLKYGSKGENVKKVQDRLKDLGYYSGAVNGKYDKQTVYAVKWFQKYNGMKVTGEVNAATRKALFSGSAKAKGAGSGAADAKATARPKATSSPEKPMKYGYTSDAIRQAQERLAELGYFSGKADGKYDAETKNAVALFQKANKLSINGKQIDSATLKKLRSSSAVSRSQYYSTCAVGKSDSGYVVKLVQKRLKELGYFSGPVTGKYGSITVAAVKKFQKANGLRVTGNCDYKTREAMNAKDAGSSQKAAVSAKPKEKTTAKPAATTQPKATSSTRAQKIETVIAAAQAQLGKPYVFGQAGMKAFDCSGLTMYCYGLVGISLPHSAYAQGYQDLPRLSAGQLQRGDLMVFNTNTTDGDMADHAGIYLGDGKFIHASSAKRQVYISDLSDYAKSFSWGLRLF